MNYCMQDCETGNFVSSNSILIDGGKLYYSTFTGRDLCGGLEYNLTQEQAEKKMSNFIKKMNKYGLHKNLKIVGVDITALNIGNIYTVEYVI
jgi:hypothetical protein